MKVLLVGGRFDGKLRDIDDPEREPFIEMNYVPPLSAEYMPDRDPQATSFMIERVNYQRIRWTVIDDQGQQCYRYVYAYCRSPAQLFDRLLEHYAPTKDERIKALEEEVRDLSRTLREANMMIGNHHRARLGL